MVCFPEGFSLRNAHCGGGAVYAKSAASHICCHHGEGWKAIIRMVLLRPTGQQPAKSRWVHHACSTGRSWRLPHSDQDPSYTATWRHHSIHEGQTPTECHQQQSLASTSLYLLLKNSMIRSFGHPVFKLLQVMNRVHGNAMLGAVSSLAWEAG